MLPRTHKVMFDQLKAVHAARGARKRTSHVEMRTHKVMRALLMQRSQPEWEPLPLQDTVEVAVLN
eukprot:11410802-Alexandrium_andersonii.AAC.1